MAKKFARMTLLALVLFGLSGAVRAAGSGKAVSDALVSVDSNDALPSADAAAAVSMFGAPSAETASRGGAGAGSAIAEDADTEAAESGWQGPGLFGRAWCGDPRWTARADALLLCRSATRGPQLLSDPVSNNTFLNSADLGFAYEAGPRLSLIRDGCDWGLELNYFSIDGWQSDADFPNSAFPNLIGTLNVDNSFPSIPVFKVSFEERSRLYSGELNLRRPINGWLTLLAGFRWVELEDDYIAQGAEANLSAFSESIRAHNHLFGLQSGLDAVLLRFHEQFRITGFVKSGVFYNSAGQSTVLSLEGLPPSPADATGGQASFLGEIGLGASYQLTKHAAFRCGYEAMWLEGVALAPRQIPNTDLLAGTAEIEASGTLFYHGANAGLELNW